MQRYFVKNSQIKNDEIEITNSDVHHITTVMRGQIGDEILLCSDCGVTYFSQIIELNKTAVRLKLIGEKEENSEMPVHVVVAQGLAKSDKLEMVVQKITECGAVGFIPTVMKRSVVKVDSKKIDKKLERWQKIALEAARQSHRQVVPEIYNLATFDEVTKMAKDYDLCFFGYEAHTSEVASGLKDVIASLKPGMKVLALIGPEGGIDPDEVIKLVAAGFIMVGLGPRIMRTETAPVYMMAALSYGIEIERKI